MMLTTMCNSLFFSSFFFVLSFLRANAKLLMLSFWRANADKAQSLLHQPSHHLLVEDAHSSHIWKNFWSLRDVIQDVIPSDINRLSIVMPWWSCIAKHLKPSATGKDFFLENQDQYWHNSEVVTALCLSLIKNVYCKVLPPINVQNAIKALMTK